MSKNLKNNLIFFFVFVLFLAVGLFNLNQLGKAEASSCPFTSIEGRTIINFDVKIRSDSDYSKAYVSKNINLPAGIYKITTFSYDGYSGRENASQPNEIWKVVLKNNNNIITETKTTTDIKDYVAYDEKIDVVAENLIVSSNITSVVALHGKYPDTSSPNSVSVGCIAFDFIPFPTPTVDIKANGSDGPITIAYNNSAVLSWTSTNATTCNASGAWSGARAISGSEATGNLTSSKTYTIICTGLGGSASDNVVVNVSPNNPPVAEAGPNREVNEGNSITLQGSGYDPDGDSISYSWSCASGSLSNSNTAQPIYTAPQVTYDTNYTCTLTVTDSYGLTGSDTMNVLVRNISYSLGVETYSATNVQENQATLRGYLRELGGANFANLWFQWGRTTSYGYETSKQAKTSTGSFNYTIYGLSPNTLYHFRAVGERDGQIAYGQDRTFSTVGYGNNPPVADAGPDKEVYESEAITLSGSGYDPDGDPIDYYWTCSGGSISNRYTAQPRYTAPQVDYNIYYSCTLTVSDSRGLSESDEMRVLVKNRTLPIISEIIDLEVEKSVKNISRGDTTWYNYYIHASSSDLINFQIKINSKSNVRLENIMVKDILPSKIIYQGNLKIDGNSDLRDITSKALNIGDLEAGKEKTITFSAKVAAEENFAYGETELINTVLVYNEQISRTDTCKVIVRRKGVAGIITGITYNTILDSLLLPLIIAFLLVWLFKSKLLGLDKWLEQRKQEIGNYRAKKKLERKILQVKTTLF
ncbi:MAG: PKD domain-containing protein [Patescibacteria group bacterium]|nr:PKD domain-containing protein [Patescibacteria group bacterium]